MSTGDNGNVVVKLDGREFKLFGQALTTRQDWYVQGHLRESGATKILEKEKFDVKADTDAVLALLQISGRGFNVLATFLVEVGKKWTVEIADANAAAFGDITEVSQKLFLHSILQTTVTGFFENAGTPSELSPNSLEPGDAPEHAAPPNSGKSAELVTMASSPS